MLEQANQIYLEKEPKTKRKRSKMGVSMKSNNKINVVFVFIRFKPILAPQSIIYAYFQIPFIIFSSFKTTFDMFIKFFFKVVHFFMVADSVASIV